GGQPLRGGRELLPLQRRGESRAHHHGECAARGRSPEGAHGRARRRHGRPRRGEPLVILARRIAWTATLLGLVLARPAPAAARTGAPLVRAVGPVGLTVSDMDRSIDFYSRVLTFEKVSDAEVAGSEYERLEGVFGLRMRVVRMRLGGEELELTEYLAPRG